MSNSRCGGSESACDKIALGRESPKRSPPQGYFVARIFATATATIHHRHRHSDNSTNMNRGQAATALRTLRRIMRCHRQKSTCTRCGLILWHFIFNSGARPDNELGQFRIQSGEVAQRELVLSMPPTLRFAYQQHIGGQVLWDSMSQS